METFALIEQSALAVLVRDTIWGFPIVLTIHSIALAFVAGINFAVALRLLGATPRLPLSTLNGYLPAMWMCFALCVVSGLGLLAAYPAKALTNGVFYSKMVLVAAGLVLVHRVIHTLGRPDAPAPARWQGILLLLCWGGAVTTGRLLAYTHHILLSSDPF